jgi:hypothetical protein
MSNRHVRGAKFSWRSHAAWCVLVVLACCGAPEVACANGPCLTVDCLPGTPGCEELRVQGDPYYVLPNGTASTFSGYADPCIRRNPLSGVFWLIYSWPNFGFIGGVKP